MLARRGYPQLSGAESLPAVPRTEPELPERKACDSILLGALWHQVKFLRQRLAQLHLQSLCRFAEHAEPGQLA